MITNDMTKIEAVKSEEYLDMDNMYSIIPANVRLHMQRVKKYSSVIAKMLKNSGKYADEDIDYICSKSNEIFMYHDIGYSFLPVKTKCRDEVLNIFDMKKFFEMDFDCNGRFANHPELGEETFDLPMFNNYDKKTYGYARAVALSHHERWDGQGFPNKIAGKDIPLVARICAAADMYDMLIEFSPYDIDHNNSGIITQIGQMAGNYLDPDIVSIIVNNSTIMMECDKECGNIVEYSLEKEGI